MERTEINDNATTEESRFAPVILKSEKEATEFCERLVSYLNEHHSTPNSYGFATPLPGGVANWSYVIIHYEFGIQFQLKREIIFDDLASVQIGIDLFGASKMDAPAKMINGVLHDSYDYNGVIFHKEKIKHTYYVFPPSPCDFYGRQVWCPRELVPYIEAYYGKNVMHKGVSHDGFYGAHEEWTAGAGDGVRLRRRL